MKKCPIPDVGKIWSKPMKEIRKSAPKVIFTVAKPSIQDLGGASPLGKHYAKNTGISVVRNAREISFKTSRSYKKI